MIKQDRSTIRQCPRPHPPLTQQEGATAIIPYAAASEMIAARYHELSSWAPY